MLKPTNPNWFIVEKADSVGQRVLAGVQFYEGEKRNNESTPVSVQIVELYKVLTKNVDDIRNGEEDIYGDERKILPNTRDMQCICFRSFIIHFLF